jgi:hypothetical protein
MSSGHADPALDFWSRWLLVAAGLVFLFGLAFIVAARPVQVLFETLYYTPNTGSELGADEAAYVVFMQGVLGAVMIGWAIVLALVARGPFRRADPSAWNMLAVSLVVWFVADTGHSLSTGYWQNAVLNVGLLLLFAVPLAATYGRFHAAYDEQSPGRRETP